MQHSDDFRQWYVQATEASKTKAVDSSFRNLRAALHRYETLVTPISRLILDVESLIAVAYRITQERAGTCAAQNATLFLDALSDEILLTAALLADAGDEAMTLIRFFDQSYVDPAVANAQVRTFMLRVTELFIQRKVLTVQGHTSYLLKWLKSAHMVPVHGQVRSVGGPNAASRATVDRCLARLQAWVVLAQEVLRAEYPEFEAVSALSVFDLQTTRTVACGQPESLPPAVREPLTRLAQTFNLCLPNLLSEFCDYHFRAVHHFKKDGEKDNNAAWRSALMETQTRHETSARHPSQNLRTLIAIYSTACLSDSCLERHFSEAQRKITDSSRALSSDNESRRMTVLALPSSSGTLISQAQACWKEYYGSSRRGNFARIDTGRGKPRQASAAKTEKAFLRARKEALVVDTSVLETHTPASANLDDQVWTARHEQESRQQQKKRKAREDEALLANSLLEDEVQLDVLQRALAGRAHLTALRQGRARKEARVKLACTGGSAPSRLDLQSPTVYIPDNLRNSAVDEAAGEGEWTFTSRAEASILMVDLSNSMTLDSLTLWAAVLNGAWMVEAPRWACDSPYAGPAIKFKAATGIKRCVWMSPGILDEKAELCSLIRSCAGQQGSKWTIQLELQSWLQTKQASINKRQSASVIALATDTEASNHEDVGHVFNVRCFFDFIYNLDKEHSRLDLSGM